MNAAQRAPLATGSLTMFLHDLASRSSLDWAFRLPRTLRSQVLAYIGLFSPTGGSLTWDQAEELLDQLRPMLEASHIHRDGYTWLVSGPVWQAAIDRVITRRNRLQLPLTSHDRLLDSVMEVARDCR